MRGLSGREVDGCGVGEREGEGEGDVVGVAAVAGRVRIVVDGSRDREGGYC